jgi:exopolyphosphatase/guanosine-5'-triphosphate,3'-diphosphate pyrophosphatase
VKQATFTAVPVRVAVCDLGSSSFHLLVCDAESDDSLRVVARRRHLLQLGRSLGANGAIPADRVAVAVAAIRRLRRAIDDTGPEHLVAVATAALRDATNGPEVVQRLEVALESPIRLLSGVEEAELSFRGQRAGLWTGSAPMLGIDLGGGSLELTVGDSQGVHFGTSIPVGAARLQGELAVPEPLGRQGRDLVTKRTREALTGVADLFTGYPGIAARTVASGGTVRALARLATARTWNGHSSVQVNQVELPTTQVSEMSDRLKSLDLAERLALPGVSARRAPTLAIGTAIIAELGAVLGVDRFVVSEWGLREGALLDLLERQRAEA